MKTEPDDGGMQLMGRDMSNSMERSGSDERHLPREIMRRDKASYVNVSATERIASAVAGGFLTMFGLRRRGTAGYGMALLGAELLYRGASGHCKTYSVLGVSTKEHVEPGTPADVDPNRSISVRQSVYVDRPREELFALWRDFSKLPHFMEHLERVDVLSPTHSHWVVAGPAGSTVEWDAEIVDERENEWIAWRTIEPAQVPNNGTVMFCEMSDGGTDVFVTLEAQPPAGKLGELVARMFGRAPKRQVRQALQRFKEIAEGDVIHDADGLVLDEYSDDAFISADGMDALDRPEALYREDVLADVPDDGDGIAEIDLPVSNRNDLADADMGLGAEPRSAEELEDAAIGHELKGPAGVTRDGEIHGERMFDSPDGDGREKPKNKRRL